MHYFFLWLAQQPTWIQLSVMLTLGYSAAAVVIGLFTMGAIYLSEREE